MLLQKIRFAISCLFLAVGGVCCVVGCGRYLPPIPPERSSPAAVEVADVVASDSGILFSWVAPTDNVLGKQLSKLDGYRVYRRVLPRQRLAEGEQEPEYQLHAVVWDKTLAVRAERERLLQAESKPMRGAKLSAAERTIQYFDEDVRPGVQYLYKVTPFNHVGVDGPVRQFVEVLFDGARSIIRKIASEDAAGLGMGEVEDPSNLTDPLTANTVNIEQLDNIDLLGR